MNYDPAQLANSAFTIKSKYLNTMTYIIKIYYNFL